MITLVSIILYVAASFMAMGVGVHAERYDQTKVSEKATGRFTVAAFALLFILAAILQVSA